MPDLEERKDVRFVLTLIVFFLFVMLQILRAVVGKVSISSSVDLNEVAAATDGFSGADLQALVYNAHLEVIHASLTSTSDKQITSREDENSIEFTSFGGSKTTSVVSKAEELALQRRVGRVKFVGVFTEECLC
jgi:peroxin-1